LKKQNRTKIKIIEKMLYFKQNISTVTLVKMFLIKDFYIFEKKKILKIVKKKITHSILNI